jgi:hypothetical protein
MLNKKTSNKETVVTDDTAPWLPRCAVLNQALLVLSSVVERLLPRNFNITSSNRAVEPSVAGSSTHSYLLVDRDAVEPPAIRPSLKQFQQLHCLLRQCGRCQALRQCRR